MECASKVFPMPVPPPIATITTFDSPRPSPSSAGLFRKLLFLRPACHTCPYASVDRPGDLSLGAFYGLPKDAYPQEQRSGVSLLLVNTPHGAHVFDTLPLKRELRPLSEAVTGDPALSSPVKQAQRAEFFDAYARQPFQQVRNHYLAAQLLLAAGSKAQGPAKDPKSPLFSLVLRSVYGKNTDAHLLRSLLRLLHPAAAERGIEPVAYWYNPNIHPYQEYKARRDTLMAYAPTIGMELIVQENYGLREFCRAVCGDIDHRCSVCYALQLAQAAQYAARHAGDSFTTTLLVSPYQNHELLAETQRSAWAGSTVSGSCTGTSAPASGRDSRRQVRWAFICRSTAAACSARKTATKRSSGIRRSRRSTYCHHDEKS